MNPQRFYNRAQIQDNQLLRLRHLLTHLAPGNPFYSSKLRAADLTPQTASLEDFTRRMPFTLKDELVTDQFQHSPYGTNLTYPLEHYSRYCQTSATTGSPLRWLDTQDSWLWMLDCWRQIFDAVGVRSTDRLFFAFSFAPFLGFWTAFESAVRLGCLCIPGGGLTSVARLGMMIDNQINVLCCTPTYALRLAEVAREEGVDLSQSRVRKIIVAGEPGGSMPAVRSRIEKLWPGSRVFDHHGMTETGPVSYPCPASPDRIHILESDHFAEIVDPRSGLSISPGNMGELVLTNFGRVGTPLLRYRTGDLVTQVPDETCACGSHEMALQGGILGRTDDMVTVRGVNIYPSALDEIVRAMAGVLEYRVSVETRRELVELTIEVEPSPECQDATALAQSLMKTLTKVFALRIPVNILPQGSLPRFEMKARRWVRL